MKFLRRAAHIVSILAPLAFVASVAWSQPKQSGAEQRQPEKQNAVTSPKSPAEQPAINIQVSNGNQQTGPNSKTHEQDSDPAIKYATILMAVFSFVLAVIGGLQWNTLRRQADAMEQQLGVVRSEVAATKDIADATRQSMILTHRPRIVVRNVVVEALERLTDKNTPVPQISKDWNGGPVAGHCHIVNVGQTTATIIGIHTSAITAERLPMKRPYDDGIQLPPINTPLAAGASMKINLSASIVIESDDLMELTHSSRTTKLNVFFFAFIEYKDDIGQVRQTAVCRRLDPITHRFIIVNDPDYEYAD